MAAATAVAQGSVTISGRVTNDHGAPLAGAEVFIPSLSVGSQTDTSGDYSFVVSGARATGQTTTITARLIGYTAQSATITLTAGTNITQNFTLTASALRLSEVVVTGAGTSTTRARLTTTINTIDSASL